MIALCYTQTKVYSADTYIGIRIPNIIYKMKKLAILTMLLFSVLLLFGQAVNEPKERSIGVNYFGELGFNPGLEIDYGMNLLKKEKERKKRVMVSQLNLRPSIAYYHYSHYSNNVLISMKLNYQVKFVNKENNKYLFIEPFMRIGYLRYFLVGDVFETKNNVLEKVRFAGSNSFVLGGAFDLGGYISKRYDWLLGFDYYAESTEDRLILHRFAAKLGTRIKLNIK